MLAICTCDSADGARSSNPMSNDERADPVDPCVPIGRIGSVELVATQPRSVCHPHLTAGGAPGCSPRHTEYVRRSSFSDPSKQVVPNGHRRTSSSRHRMNCVLSLAGWCRQPCCKCGPGVGGGGWLDSATQMSICISRATGTEATSGVRQVTGQSPTVQGVAAKCVCSLTMMLP